MYKFKVYYVENGKNKTGTVYAHDKAHARQKFKTDNPNAYDVWTKFYHLA